MAPSTSGDCHFGQPSFEALQDLVDSCQQLTVSPPPLDDRWSALVTLSVNTPTSPESTTGSAACKRNTNKASPLEVMHLYCCKRPNVSSFFLHYTDISSHQKLLQNPFKIIHYKRRPNALFSHPGRVSYGVSSMCTSEQLGTGTNTEVFRTIFMSLPPSKT